MSLLKVGFDLDGILCKWNDSYIDLIKKYTGIELPYENDHYPDTWYFERAAGVEKSRENAMWKEIKESDTFWSNLAPYPDSVEAMNRYQEWSINIDEGVEDYFITNRMGKVVKEQTEDWLINNLTYYNPTVLIARNKGLAALTLDLDFYIDDRLENCEDVVKESPNTRCYLLDRPWNKAFTPEKATRVYNLDVFVDDIMTAGMEKQAKRKKS